MVRTRHLEMGLPVNGPRISRTDGIHGLSRRHVSCPSVHSIRVAQAPWAIFSPSTRPRWSLLLIRRPGQLDEIDLPLVPLLVQL